VVDGINDTMAQGNKERQQALDNQIEKENHLAAIKEQQRNATAELNRQQVSQILKLINFWNQPGQTLRSVTTCRRNISGNLNRGLSHRTNSIS
jgi:hypothetical protein